MSNPGDPTTAHRLNFGRDLPARWMRVFLAAFLAGLVGHSALGAKPENRTAVGVDVDHPMYLDPVLEWPRRVGVFSPRLGELWLAALKRPHAQTRCLAVEAIIDAHRRGMKGWDQSADLLTEMFESPTEHPQVRLALAKALSELDVRSSADVMLRASRDDLSDMILIVDPALVAWDHKPARAIWRQRIIATDVSRVVRVSAIRALALVKDTQAADALKVLALNLALDTPMRLEAAQALGSMTSGSLESDAEALIGPSGKSVVDRLVAAHLLSGHGSDRAKNLLSRLADDPAPSVAVIALRRLLTLDAQAVFSRTGKLASMPDGNLRRIAVDALILRADTAAVATLGRLLDDPDRTLRIDVRNGLARLASKQSLADAVAQAAIKQLKSDRWRGLEQAALLSAKINHKPAAELIAGYLDFDRPEVRMAVIVALRRLKVESTSSAMLRRAQFLAQGARAYRKDIQAKYFRLQDIYKERKAAEARKRNVEVKRLNREAKNIQDNVFPLNPAIENELSQLFQALGLIKYQPSDPLMRQFIAKGSGLPPEARSAAIWGLGYIHQGKPDPALVKLFLGRLTDESDSAPEYDEVRRMSGVSLGRMKAKSAMGALRRYYKIQFLVYYTGGACRWAIMEITGQSLPDSPRTSEYQERGWFLEPLY